jgi:hypothetical protein
MRFNSERETVNAVKHWDSSHVHKAFGYSSDKVQALRFCSYGGLRTIVRSRLA